MHSSLVTCSALLRVLLQFGSNGSQTINFYTEESNCRRRDGKSARIVFNPAIYGEARLELGRLHRKQLDEGLSPDEEKLWKETRAAASKRVMEADLAALFEVKPAVEPVPQKARILASLICDACKEAVMETRSRRMHEQTLCIPCFEARETR